MFWRVEQRDEYGSGSDERLPVAAVHESYLNLVLAFKLLDMFFCESFGKRHALILPDLGAGHMDLP